MCSYRYKCIAIPSWQGSLPKPHQAVCCRRHTVAQTHSGADIQFYGQDIIWVNVEITKPNFVSIENRYFQVYLTYFTYPPPPLSSPMNSLNFWKVFQGMLLAGTFMVQMKQNHILRRKRVYQRVCMLILREFEKNQVSIKFKVIFPKNDP